MKNIFKSAMKYILLGGAMALSLASCVQEEEQTVAKAVLGNENVLNFAAESPQGKVIKIVSDAEWTATVPSWITVDPMTGSGETEVTVIAQSNTDAQGALAPRRDTLIFGGATKASQFIVIVKQDGDAYRTADHVAVSQLADLKDETPAVLDEATVTAVTKAGIVVTDGVANVYAKTVGEYVVGDKVALNAYKATEFGLTVLSPVDKATVLAPGAYEYPEAINLNENIASLKAGAMELVKVSGELEGGLVNVTIDEQVYPVKFVDVPEGVALVNGHVVEVLGYTYGTKGDNLQVLPAVITDKGIASVIYFEDDFEWLEPYSVAAAAGQSVEKNDPNENAPNIYSTGDLAPLQEELVARGYTFINSGKDGSTWTPITTKNDKTVYLQRNYLKFGKTDYNTGIVLPALSAISGADDVIIEFDWCWQVTGSYNPDLMTLQIDAANGGTFAESGSATSLEIESAQITEETKSAIEWQHVAVVLNGATAETVLTIRPTNSDPRISNPSRKQNRWYIDNIKIAPANGGSVGPKLVYADDFEWIEPYATASGAGDSVGSNDASATSPNVYSSVPEFVTEFNSRGYDYFWAKTGTDVWRASDDSNAKVLYINKNYLKFGKTDYNAGLIVPALKDLTGPTDVVIEFDYCFQITGAGVLDGMALHIETNAGTFETSGSNVSDGLTTEQPAESSKLFWTHAKVVLNGATAETVLKIRPANPDPRISSTTKCNRWFFDNLKITRK